MNGILSPDENPAYGDWESLPGSLWDEIERADKRFWPEELGDMGQKEYHLPFLGNTLIIDPAARHLSWKDSPRSPSFQEGLVALSYLANLKPVDPSPKWLSPVELPGGRTFFGPGSHPPKTENVLKAWTDHPSHFKDVIKALKGTPIPEGDEGFQIPCLPKVSLRYVFWKGEEGLSSAVTLLVNATVHLFLPLDVLWALINLTDRCFEIPG